MSKSSIRLCLKSLLLGQCSKKYMGFRRSLGSDKLVGNNKRSSGLLMITRLGVY